MADFIVTGAALVARLGREGKEGEIYLYKGDLLPSGVLVAESKRLADLGLVAEVAEVVAAEPVPTEPVPTAPVSTKK